MKYVTQKYLKFCQLCLVCFQSFSNTNINFYFYILVIRILKSVKPNEYYIFKDAARYNLATRIMSNGIGVIVADDKSTLPGNPDVLRVPNKFYKTITMKGSTLQDNMQLMLPSSYNQVKK